MARTLAALIFLIPAVADARGRIEVTAPNVEGARFARQALPAAGKTTTLAESRTIYLNPNTIVLRPGDNDSSNDVSSIVESPTLIGGWDIDEATWQETVDCVKDMYSRFDVVVTDEDPGDVPHIEAHFGGHPADVGLPDNVLGVSPFTTDCSIIEHSIVFTFTDVMQDDPQAMCEVMSQEIAHSFGLDHEMLAEDPMTYLPFLGPRAFQDEMASCGEYGQRMCGIQGSVCRERQNSVALLTARLGANPNAPAPDDESTTMQDGIVGGCSTGGGNAGIGFVLLVGHLVARRRTRHRRRGAVLQ